MTTPPTPPSTRYPFGWDGDAPQPAPQPAPPKRPWFKKKAILIPIAAGLLGLALGAATQPEPEVVTVEKEKVVEKVVDRPVEKRVEVKVPATPAVCIEYIDLSEQAFSLSAEAMRYMNDALQAAGRVDVAGVEAASAKLSAVNPKLTTLSTKVNATKAECRASE